MSYLLDTNVCLWVLFDRDRLSAHWLTTLDDSDNELVFSVVSLWEIVIKRALNKEGFMLDPNELRDDLLGYECQELEVSAAHVLEVQHLPALHRDPFDRLLVAQALAEGLTLLTADRFLTQYSDEITIV